MGKWVTFHLSKKIVFGVTFVLVINFILAAAFFHDLTIPYVKRGRVEQIIKLKSFAGSILGVSVFLLRLWFKNFLQHWF